MNSQYSHTADTTLAGANALPPTSQGGEMPPTRTLDRALFAAMALGALCGSIITVALIFLAQGVAK